MKKINYYVIGGWDEAHCHGGCETLLGAKRLAGKHIGDHYDNFLCICDARYDRPDIYAAEDCHLEETMYYGTQMVPNDDAVPVAAYDKYSKAWVRPQRWR